MQINIDTFFVRAAHYKCASYLRRYTQKIDHRNMNKYKITILVFVVALLTACAGVGVVATSDPLTKFNDAEHLFMKQGRPLIAERLIHEAMAIYKERGDNRGLGHAHREYADLLLSIQLLNGTNTTKKMDLEIVL